MRHSNSTYARKLRKLKPSFLDCTQTYAFSGFHPPLAPPLNSPEGIAQGKFSGHPSLDIIRS